MAGKNSVFLRNRAGERRLTPGLLLLLAAACVVASGAWALRAQQTLPTRQSTAAQTPPQNPRSQQAPSAEPPPSAANVSVETKLVAVYATVRDKRGKIVP